MCEKCPRIRLEVQRQTMTILPGLLPGTVLAHPIWTLADYAEGSSGLIATTVVTLLENNAEAIAAGQLQVVIGKAR